MKKTFLIVASLALGTAAVAQDQPAGSPTQGSPPMANTPAPGAPAGPESQTTPPAADPATAPAGQSSGVTSPSPGAANGMSGNMGASSGNMGQAQQMASSTDTSNYPKCSRTVTDKCVSTGKATSNGKRRR